MSAKISCVSKILAAVALVGLGPGNFAQADIIAFGAPQTISGDSDVYDTGTTVYAYAWSNLTKTVNGVTFTGTNSATGAGSDVVFSSSEITKNHLTAFGSQSGSPWNGLSADYQDILRGGDWADQRAALTVTLGNLTVGHDYAVQLWYHDNRATYGYTATFNSPGGTSVSLLKNNTNASGGVGQYTIGLFTADAATQTVTVQSAAFAAAQVNALQLRDLTVPEPGTLLLLCAGAALGLLAYAWRKRR